MILRRHDSQNSIFWLEYENLAARGRTMGAPLICAICSAGMEAIMSDSAEESSPPTGLAGTAAAGTATVEGTTLWEVDLAPFGVPLALSAADFATASWKLLSDASLLQTTTGESIITNVEPIVLSHH